MAFTLPDLPYDGSALEPHIDTATMKIHHGKHHAAYVANLNKALEGAGIKETNLDALLANGCSAVPENIRTKRPLDLEKPRAERTALSGIKSIAAKALARRSIAYSAHGFDTIPTRPLSSMS